MVDQIARLGRNALAPVGQMKPAGVGLPSINWNHPLAAGLLFYAYDVPEANATPDLVSGTWSSTSNLSTTVTPFGPATLYAGTGRDWGTMPNSTFIGDANANGNYTWASAWYQTGTSAQYAQPFGRTANSGTAQPFNNFDFELNPGGIGQTWCRATWNNNGLQAVSGNLTVASNVFQSAVGILTGGPGANSATGTATVNGVSQGGSTFNITPANFSIGSKMQIGNIPGAVFYGAFWGRVLSVNETTLLHTDPWCFLLFDTYDDLQFPLTSVAPSPTVYMVSGSRPGLPSVAAYDNSNLTTMVSDVGAELSYTSSVSANANITGVAGTGGVGTPTIGLGGSHQITGVSGSSGVGTVTASLGESLTGVSATGGVGSVTTAGSASPQLSGVAGSTSAGTIRVEIDEALTGVSATGAVGSPTITTFIPANLTGFAIASSIGSFGETITETLAGVSFTGSVGSEHPGVSLTGTSASFAVNTLTVTLTANIHLTGIAMTSAVGAAYDQISMVVPGVDLWGETGVISDDGDVDVPHANREVNGNLAHFSVGAFGRRQDFSRTVPSVAMASAVGGFPAHRISYTLTGNAITSHVGTIHDLISAGGLRLDDLQVTQYNVITLDDNVALCWSDDKGETWRFPISKSLGEGGDYFVSLQWRRLGMGRDRVFSISYSAPCETSITGIWYEIENAQT